MTRNDFDYYMFRVIEAGREQINARHVITDPKSEMPEIKREKERLQHFAEVADEALDEMCDKVGRNKLSNNDYNMIEMFVQGIWGCESRKARMYKTMLDTDNERIRVAAVIKLKMAETEEKELLDKLFLWLNK